MLSFLRRFFCKHTFIHVTTYRMDVVKGVGYDEREIFVLYCPKCRKSEDVLKHEYERIVGIQQVDENYRNNQP